MEDMKLWLVGGGGEINAVTILTWKGVKNSNRVEGTVELFGRDDQGMPILLQSEPIFPVPEPALGQGTVPAVHLTRQMLLGSTIRPNTNPADLFELTLDRLRVLAAEEMGFHGLVPAQDRCSL